jgi:hypothetical protein
MNKLTAIAVAVVVSGIFSRSVPKRQSCCDLKAHLQPLTPCQNKPAVPWQQGFGELPDVRDDYPTG